jgi:hypothetical protein
MKKQRLASHQLRSNREFTSTKGKGITNMGDPLEFGVIL